MSDLKYRIQIPGKTFLFGEYSALVGGSALLITTGPGFEMFFSQPKNQLDSLSGSDRENPFHPQSPAGRFYEMNSPFFSGWKIEFIDHYLGRGGFGASTAQFLGLAFFKSNQEKTSSLRTPKEIYKSIWDQYELSQPNIEAEIPENNGQVLAGLPSGYDLWAQCLGGLSTIERQTRSEAENNFSSYLKNAIEFNSSQHVWPFSELDFLIVPTGFKVATHDHIKNLNDSSFSKLKLLSRELMDSFKKENQKQFLNLMASWQVELFDLDLIHSNTVQLLKTLSESSEILFSKGCGALGADVILLVFLSKNKSRVRAILNDINLKASFGQGDMWNQKITVQVC